MLVVHNVLYITFSTGDFSPDASSTDATSTGKLKWCPLKFSGVRNKQHIILFHKTDFKGIYYAVMSGGFDANWLGQKCCWCFLKLTGSLTRKSVRDCDIRAVLHSCGVFDLCVRFQIFVIFGLTLGMSISGFPRRCAWPAVTFVRQ